jgi:carbamoyl-phosphate synthase large subunit
MMTRTRRSRAFTLLFTCVGRRVELLQAFRAAARRLGFRLRIVGTDSDPTAPALSCVDDAVIVPRAADAGYMDAVLDAVRAYGAALLIPTIDTDLVVVSQHRAAIAELGCTPLIAEPEIISTCRDKVRTYEHLCRHNIDTPPTWTPDQLPPPAKRRFPLFIKPRGGSASQWVHKLEDAADLEYYLHRVGNPIIQEFVAGVEHTLDVYVGLTGVPRCVVPRARWQVRGGEVCKGVVVKDLDIMNAGRHLVETLGPSPRGLVTLQCIVTPQHRIRFIEINPRFGGGVPLAIAAGADFPAWLLQELAGRSPAIAFDSFQHGLCMLRYDWSVFLSLEPDLRPRLTRPLRPPPSFLR